METTVSEKGQITVPKPLRERLGIRAGDRLDVTEEKGQLVLRKAVLGDPVSSVYGILALRESADEAVRALRGDVDAV